MNSSHVPAHLADAAQRERALDASQSFLVQAPAGSGKTELLVLRYLALLPTVEQPEQVLAITFTRKAASEMRVRVLQALEAAGRDEGSAANDHERSVRRHARAALAHAEARDWRLLQQPQRLNIKTIDSLALSIAYQMPLLSRLGGQLTPVDEARPMYALAAERVMAHLGSTEEPELAAALERMLVRRDASLPDCESLIAAMLNRRDQWMLVLPVVMQAKPDWEALRAQLEEPFQREHAAVLAGVRTHFANDPGLVTELLDLGRIACENGQLHLDPLRSIRTVADLDNAEHWRCLSSLLLKKDGAWRHTIDGRSGFPAKTHRADATRLKTIIEHLSGDDELRQQLCALAELPPASYTEEEWRTVQSIFVVLRRAVAELHVVFAEQGVIDFIQAGQAASAALNDAGVLMWRDENLRHLLVDEFQDTSRAHFALLNRLLEEWQSGDARTCFFVGDPMQSIYLFRGAESQLFDQVRKEGLALPAADHPLTELRLETNFRSTPSIVEPLNAMFASILADREEGGVSYAPSTSSKREAAGDHVSMHVQVRHKDDKKDHGELNAAEAEDVLSVIRSHLPAIALAKENGAKYRVAVLARSRSHLVEIIDRLRQEQIPFRGVKINLLRDRPEILDILSLLRALLHPADRIAWLAVLRAPWCGLPVHALHALCGDPTGDECRMSIPDLLHLHRDRLDAESYRRASHVLAILKHAQNAYAQGALANSPASLALWLERTWHALQAPRFLSEEALDNASSFFTTLGQLPPDCFGVLDESLNQRLEDLYAEPDPTASEDYGVQLMTIHSAKGLEFEVVLVPQLHRPGKRDDAPLFHWLVRRRPMTQEDELLLAPIGRKHGDRPALHRWVGKKSTRLQKLEEKRLLYVASSRAIQELHLFATVERNKNGDITMPTENTLLRAGWEGLRARILNHSKLRAQEEESFESNVVVMPQAKAIPAGTVEGLIPALAATAAPAQVLRRLPPDSFPHVNPGQASTGASPLLHSAPLPLSPVGSRLARVQGIVLHALLEHAASAKGKLDGRDPVWERLTDVILRQHALGPAEAGVARAAVLQSLRNAFAHGEGRWLLAARATAFNEQSIAFNEQSIAFNEQSWSSMQSGRLQRQRPDRVFLAGDRPDAPGSEYLWIVDYKTAAPAGQSALDDFLATSREQYRGQLEAYSALFREVERSGGMSAPRGHRLALYHPMLPRLDWWAVP